MIKLSGVSKVYSAGDIETVALDDVNIEVKTGEFVSIMGPSGCGKSTLLNVMGLLDAPTLGTVNIDDVDTTKMNDRQMADFRNKKLGFVFQSFHLVNSLNVRDNIELPLYYRGVGATERHALSTRVMERLGLLSRAKHFPSQLSGGQCQRVAIGRAIIGNPDIILADEPTGNLDSKMGADVMSILQGLCENEGKTIIMVTHNEEQAKKTMRTIRMFDGKIGQ